MKEHNISDKAVTPKAVQNLISRSKDKLITPDKFSTKGKNGSDDYQLSTAKTIYTDYQARLEAANALDFDDYNNADCKAVCTLSRCSFALAEQI